MNDEQWQRLAEARNELRQGIISDEQFIDVHIDITNAAIAQAVQAEREAVAKSLPLTIKTAIETEREACAKVAEDYSTMFGDMAQSIAAAIRARNGAGRK